MTYDALQLYVGHVAYGQVPPTVEEEDMIDFEDIGGVYDSPAAAGTNTTRINDFLAQNSSPMLRFGGVKTAQYNNKRLPSRAYFNGTVVIPNGKPVTIDGAGGRLSWTGLASPTTPGIHIEPHGMSVRCLLFNFDADTDGSGIRLETPGKGTVIRDIQFADPSDPNTIACTGASGAVSLDDHTDLETASYAYKIENSDGFSMLDCSAMKPADHGIIVTRLHDGVVRARLWGAANGTGFKAQGLNDCQIDIVSESNHGYGYDLSHCGVPVVENNIAGNTTHNKPGVADFWVENNNYRSNPALGGILVRQGKMRHCGSKFVTGSNAWGSNKIDLDEPTRNRCQMIHDVYISQSVAPMYDLTNEDDQAPTFTLPDQTASAANNNFDAVWGASQPTVTTVGTQGSLEFLITFPANSFAGLTGATAYWRPWGLLTNFTPQDGDGYEYQMELSASLDGYNWCNTNDQVNSTIVIPTIAPYSGPAGTNWVGLYNSQPRKFIGRASLGSGNTGHATPAFTWSPNLPDNPTPFTLSVKALLFYGIRATGGAIPQS